MPEPTVKPRKKKPAKKPTIVVDRVVDGPYTLPSLELLIAGDPPLRRSAGNDRMIEAVLADTVRFEWISRRGDKVEVISAYDGLDLIV